MLVQRTCRRILILASASATWCLMAGCSATTPSQSVVSAKTPEAVVPTAPTPLPSTSQLPTDIPYDVPLAPGMACIGVSRVREDMLISLHSRKSIEELVTWFHTALADKEWTAEPDQQEESVVQLAFRKNRRRCEIAIRDDAKAQVGGNVEEVREVQLRTSL